MDDLPKIRIHIKGNNQNRYKSITELIWDDLPGFAVLTGLNGSGKTQLLESLAYGLNGISPPGFPLVPITVTGDTVKKGETAFLPSNQEFTVGQPATLTPLRQLKMNLHGQLLANTGDLRMIARRNRAERQLDVDISTISGHVFADMLPDELLFLLNDVDLTAELAQVFAHHRFKILRLLERGRSSLEAEAELGPPPWQIINETLSAADFPYQMRAPGIDTEIYDQFEITLSADSDHAVLRSNDLSSGEKLILETVLWLFVAKKRTAFPKLFLMDEPDAHLHPSMAQRFLSVVSGVLVDKHKIRVIITTHSPSTVALSPEGSIFEINRSDSQVRPIKRADAISLLTAGLVTVSPGTKQ